MASMTGRPQHGEVDGIGAVWIPGRPSSSARLLLRAGVTDEHLLVHGWTHVAEHWVLSSAGLPRFEHNGTTQSLHVSFDLAGAPERLRAGLGELGQRLRVLHDAGTAGQVPDGFAPLARDASVVRAEAERRGVYASPIGREVARRVGHRGVGLVEVFELGLLDLDEQRLAAFLGPRLVASNAVLLFDGEPPEDVALGLAVGQPAPAPSVPSSVQGPVRHFDRALGLCLETSADLGGDLLATACALSLDVRAQVDRLSLDSGRDLLAFPLDETQLPRVAELLRTGPDQATLDRTAATIERREASSLTLDVRASRDAVRWLQTGRPPGSAASTSTWDEVLGSVSILAPHSIELPAELPALGRAPRATGRVLPAVVPDRVPFEVVEGDGYVQIAWPEGAEPAVDLGALAGARRYPDGSIELYPREQGSSFLVEPWSWQDGYGLVERLWDRIDPGVRRVDPLGPEAPVLDATQRAELAKEAERLRNPELARRRTVRERAVLASMAVVAALLMIVGFALRDGHNTLSVSFGVVSILLFAGLIGWFEHKADRKRRR